VARPADPQRRAKTLAKATEYVLEHGIAGLSLRPLAAALGTSTRMLLYDFESKEKLIAAILAEARRREAALLTEHATAVASPEDLLHDVWSWISAPERRPFLRLFFEVYLDAITHGSTEGKAMVTDWLSTVGAALSPGDDDPATATLVIAVVRGLLLDALATGDHDRVDAALDRFTDLLSRGSRAAGRH
jgi:AcrR family transcriptional regulator